MQHTELVEALTLRGLPVPTGAGVSVTQVETPNSGSGATNYLPDASDAEFLGKTINDVSGAGTSSTDPILHATRVAWNLYGLSTSMAPNINTIDVYDSGDWINNQGWATGTPVVEDNPLQNHSWVGFSTSNTITARMDAAVVRDGFLPIVGLYNSDIGPQNIPSDIPEIYGSIYNGISVGVSDGTHRVGVTSSYDGPNRTKPEIVAPNSFTSYATPYITAAAAMLIESADTLPTVTQTDAKNQLVLKAILLAAADKSPFADWDQTLLRPIDDIYGAGQLDVYENYFIQQAGQQTQGSTIQQRGWNKASLDNNGSHTYHITVPEGFTLRNLSALVTWNRTVSTSGSGRFKSYIPDTLANLSLTLESEPLESEPLESEPLGISQISNSSVDNIEHIWRDVGAELSVGDYTLTVATDLATDYAIAWRSQLYQNYTLWTSSAFTNTPTEDQDTTDDPDKDGIINLHELAFGGDPEAYDTGILPSSQTIVDQDERYLEISFRKPKHLNDLTYTVETVTDLNGEWVSTTAEVYLHAINIETDDFDRYVYRRVAPISAHEKAFLRVSVSE